MWKPTTVGMICSRQAIIDVFMDILILIFFFCFSMDSMASSLAVSDSILTRAPIADVDDQSSTIGGGHNNMDDEEDEETGENGKTDEGESDSTNTDENGNADAGENDNADAGENDNADAGESDSTGTNGNENDNEDSSDADGDENDQDQGVDEDPQTTSISSVDIDKPASVVTDRMVDEAYYTLQGVKILHPQPGRVYIHNRKKILIKK